MPTSFRALKSKKTGSVLIYPNASASKAAMLALPMSKPQTERSRPDLIIAQTLLGSGVTAQIIATMTGYTSGLAKAEVKNH